MIYSCRDQNSRRTGVRPDEQFSRKAGGIEFGFPLAPLESAGLMDFDI